MTVHEKNVEMGWDALNGDQVRANWYADATLQDGLPPPPPGSVPPASYATGCAWVAANHSEYTDAGV